MVKVLSCNLLRQKTKYTDKILKIVDVLNSCSKMLLLLFLFSISLSFLLYQGLQNLSLSYLPEKAFVYFIINDLLLPSIISSLCLFFLHHFGLAGITIIKKKFHLVFFYNSVSFQVQNTIKQQLCK